MPRLKTGISLSATSDARFKKVMKHLSQIPDIDLPKALNTEASRTVDRMRRDAPVDTHRLERNIHFTQTGKLNVEFDSKAIDPKSGIDYAPLQEFGIGVPEHRYFYKNIRKFRQGFRDRLATLFSLKGLGL